MAFVHNTINLQSLKSPECLAKLIAGGMAQSKGKIQWRIKSYQGEIYVFAYASHFLCVPYENERHENSYS